MVLGSVVYLKISRAGAWPTAEWFEEPEGFHERA
jgi:hypothetical protein